MSEKELIFEYEGDHDYDIVSRVKDKYIGDNYKIYLFRDSLGWKIK